MDGAATFDKMRMREELKEARRKLPGIPRTFTGSLFAVNGFPLVVLFSTISRKSSRFPRDLEYCWKMCGELMPRKTSSPSLPVAQPASKTSRGMQRTEEMVRVASELFLEQGYEKTSLDEIIHKTGGSKAHVYRKFEGKEGLFLACIQYLCDEIQLSIEAPDISAQPAEAGLRILSRGLVEVLLGDRHIAFQRLVFAEAARFPKAGEIWFHRGPQTTGRIFQQAIQQWMQSGELRHGDARLTANLFCDMLSGHILDRTWLGIGRKPSALEVSTTINTAVCLFLNGFGPAKKVKGIRPARIRSVRS
jgi:AcrR family transcriptional regulator